MVRKLAAALLGVGVFIPGLANALGLGEIKLNSALSEPLDAEIELVQVRELTAPEILPNLAANSDFESAGVERSQFLSDLKFEVAVNEKGKSFIRVRSTKPVKEPFLNFLVEVNWPAGRLLREYTLFLDPPVYSAQRTQAPAPARAAAAPASRPASKPAAKAPAPSYSPAESTETASEPAAASGGGASHTIGANDSLWAIARDLKPSDDVSIHQTMIALQRVNPDAFINDNINLMKKGQVLRAPTVEEAQQVSSREAIEMVAEQNRLWREKLTARKSGAPAAEAPQMDLTGRSLDQEPAAAPVSDEGRLKLLSGAGADSESGKGGSAEAGGGELRNKLAVAEENIDKFKLENEDLKVKMNDLSDQLKTSEKVLTLKDQQIAALQAKLEEMEAKAKQAAKAEAKPAVTTPEPEAVAPVSAEIEEPVAAVTEPAQPEVDFNYQEEKPAVAETPVAETPATPAPEAAATETPAPEVAPTEAATTAPETPVAESTPVAETEPAVKEDLPPAEEPAIVMDEQPVVVEQPKAAEPAKPVAKPEPAASSDLLTQLISNPLYLGIGAGAIVLLLAAGMLAMRRKKADDELDNALVEDFELPENTGNDLADEAEMDFEDRAEALEEVAESAREETVPQTADVIGEADIYIAYGRYPQAIEMLQKAADKEPGRADIRLKLCEVCVDAKEPDIFMKHYNVLQGLGDAGALRRAEELRGRILPAAGAAAAAVPLAFAQPNDETLVAQPDEEAALDFDIADAEPADVASELEQESDTGLDFDLGDLEDTGATFAEAPAPVSQDVSAGLDFDLDLDLQQPEPAPVAARDDNSLDFDFDIAESAPAVQEAAPSLQPSDNAMDFDAEFSLDSVDETAGQVSSAVTFDEDMSLDFDQVETAQTPTAVAEDSGLDFDLEFDTGSVQPATFQEEDRTIAFTPSAPMPGFAGGAEEPVLDSQSAAQLADELDLGGDFLSHDEDATIQAPALDTSDLTIPAAPAFSAPPVAPAPQLAANDMTDSGDELDFLSDADEASTKLDLARAYIDMGDRDGAKDILDEVMIEGSDSQKQEAKELLNRLEA